MSVRSLRSGVLLVVVVLSLSGAGCTGLIDDPGASESSGRPGGGGGGVDGPQASSPTARPPGSGAYPIDPNAVDCLSAPLDVGPSAMRRLTRTEYDNTVRDLLGTTSRPASAGFAEDEKVGGFDSNAVAPVSQLGVEQYRGAAEALAADAVAGDLVALLGCDPAAIGESECVTDFVTRFGRRAWRRPLEPDELARMVGVYATMRDGGASFEDALRVLLQVFLQSPNFLYHVELGSPVPGHPQLVALSPYELAARLSYFLWGSMPDDELLDAAASGALSSPGGLETEARRLMADDRARQAIVDFHHQWLELDLFATVHKNPAQYPDFDEALRADMLRETELFVERIIFEEDGTLHDLLGASHTYLNDRLAALYGVPAPGDDAFHRVELDPGQRSGLLTHASLLAMHAKPDQSSPIHRGKFVRERLLCQPIPAPPPDIDITPPAFDPTLSTRERFAQHRDDDACSGCHNLMDPIGFGFENYDAIGAYRTHDEGFEVDASGAFFQTVDLNGEFDGVVEMADRLSESEQVRRCMAEQWMHFALRRTIGTQDHCSFEAAYERFGESGLSIREFMIAVTATDAFRYRRVPEPSTGTPSP